MQAKIEEFLAEDGKIFDVRSPGEYLQGHIPHAINLPLFSDEERKQIGIIYKKEGQKAAFQRGLEIVSPKVSLLIEEVLRLVKDSSVAKVHCWRGGLRSTALSQLFEFLGIKTLTLKDGYKSFRRLSLKLFEEGANFRVIGGLTGTGKTKILHKLKERGEQVVDLEALANHRGSAFGAIEEKSQPTTEQFQNNIAMNFLEFDLSRPVWIEDESRVIGSCHLPESLFNNMQKAPFYFIQKSTEERLENIQKEYSRKSLQSLIKALKKIQKKLGSEKTISAISLIENGNLYEAAKIILHYYDVAYMHCCKKKKISFTLHASGFDNDWCASAILKG